MPKIKVAINGFGRIGRQFFAIAQDHPNLDVVAVNDLTDPATLAHLYKYDSVYGVHPGKVSAGKDFIQVDGQKIKIFAEKDPAALPWKKLGVDVVVESTGIFTDLEGASAHIKAGAKKVVVSAPCKGEVPTFVIGCNEEKYNPKTEHVISMASCTTNAMAPIAKVLNDKFKILKGTMTTCHSYTNDQRLLDLPHKDLRRARAAALSMIPTTTGAAKAVEKVIPDLKGKLNGLAIRVPTPIVSLLDFSLVVGKNVTVDEVNNALRTAAAKDLKNILMVSDEPLVSVDFKKTTFSSIVDAELTMVVGENLIKVIAWYDNEWGYSTRLVEFAEMVGEKLK
ncbi:type I glyceraldehyde-3-phosphate dehydrogenase [Candidatus Falkowbacteria bacterium]|nr:type I glyceraldehyde-3-phosphate dehydrogenase [Candidatus Falkowbacteria bacterium]